MKKLESLQMLRAVAALLVVWAHCIDRFSQYPSFQISFFHLQNFGAVGVDVFFCISGFIMAAVATRSKSVTEFSVKRACRILPILWLILLYHAVNEFIPWHILLQNMLLLPNKEPVISLSWTLIFEWYFYVILAASMYINQTRSIHITIAFILCAVVAGWIIHPSNTALVYYTNPIMLEFVLGAAVGLMWKRHPYMPLWAAIMIFAVGCTWLVSTIFTGYHDVSQSFYTTSGLRSVDRFLIWGVPSALVMTGVVYMPTTTPTPMTKLMVYLGDASYSIYLVHIYGLSILLRIMKTFHVSVNGDFGIVMCLVIVTVISCCFHSFIERPITRFLSHHVIRLVR